MKGETFLALVAGVAAGFALGVLLAPEKGEDTRKMIKEKADEGIDEFKDLKDMLLESGAVFKDEMKKRIVEKIDAVERRFARDLEEDGPVAAS